MVLPLRVHFQCRVCFELTGDVAWNRVCRQSLLYVGRVYVVYLVTDI